MFYKISFALFLSLLLTESKAQLNPGYMGRKAFIEIGTMMGASSAIDFTTQSDFYKRPFLLAANINADINYTIGRSIVAKLGSSYLNFNVGTQHTFFLPNSSGDRDYHDAVYKVHANDLHLGFDFYFKNRQGTIAPMGTYAGLGLRILGTTRTLLEGTPGLETYKIATIQDPYTTVGLMLSLGYRTIIAHRFLFAISLSSTIFYDDSNYVGKYYVDRQYETERDLNNYIAATKVSLHTRYRLGLSISFGVFLEP